MSNFNAEQFMQTEITATGETEYSPIPESDYPGMIKDIKVKMTSGDEPKPFLEIYWIIDSQEVRDLLEDPEPVARQTVWLDVDTNGALMFGVNKNIDLNRLRSALGQNDGKPWVPTMMVGGQAVVQVKHRLFNGQPMADVKSVASAT